MYVFMLCHNTTKQMITFSVWLCYFLYFSYSSKFNPKVKLLCYLGDPALQQCSDVHRRKYQQDN